MSAANSPSSDTEAVVAVTGSLVDDPDASGSNDNDSDNDREDDNDVDMSDHDSPSSTDANTAAPSMDTATVPMTDADTTQTSTPTTQQSKRGAAKRAITSKRANVSMDDQLLLLIDPIYLTHSHSAPSTTSTTTVSDTDATPSKSVRWSHVNVHSFPLTFDPSKVPSGNSFYSIGLDYDNIGHGHSVVDLNLYESERSVSRSLTCPEIPEADRKSIWTSTSAVTINHANTGTASGSGSDESELKQLRASRALVGCSCRSVRGSTTCASVFDAYTKPHTRTHSHTDAHPCECATLGIECNSNICKCSKNCCKNPNLRFDFNQYRVNLKRRKMIVIMNRMRAMDYLNTSVSDSGSGGGESVNLSGGNSSINMTGNQRATRASTRNRRVPGG